MGESDIFAHWSALRVTSIDASQGYNPEACAVDPAPEIPLEDALSIDEIVASLPPADADAALLRGARPLRAALEAAYDHHLLEVADGTPAAVYLFTTGAANCAAKAEGLHALLELADDGVVDLIADALAEGITTIVVGISLDAEPAPDAVDMEPDGVSYPPADADPRG